MDSSNIILFRVFLPAPHYFKKNTILFLKKLFSNYFFWNVSRKYFMNYLFNILEIKKYVSKSIFQNIFYYTFQKYFLIYGTLLF